MVVHAFNPSIWEVEACRSLSPKLVWSIHSEFQTLSQNRINKLDGGGARL